MWCCPHPSNLDAKNGKMTPDEIRRSFLNTMKKHGSIAIPSANLVPENDASTLFVGSGMQPMVPYLLGLDHPMGEDLVNIQPCVRTGDIEEVGDLSHLTFFENMKVWMYTMLMSVVVK